MASILSKVLIVLLLTGAPIAASAQEASARLAWPLFVEECEHVLQDPDAYADGEVRTAGQLTFKTSPDTHSLVVNKTIGNLYVEAFIYQFADREVRNCAVYMNDPSGIETSKCTEELADWLSTDLGTRT